MSASETKKWNWMRIALVISLCVNILVLSAIGTALIGKKRFEDAGGPRFGQIDAMLRALPDDKRKELRRSFREQMLNNRPRREEMRALRQDVNEALTADPYAAADLTEALAAQRAFREMQSARAEAIWVEIYSSLTPEERATFAEKLKEHMKRKGHKKKKDRP
ncbi:MAG: periplasmic heavy metal sensor [Pseudomonadota bacterium]